RADDNYISELAHNEFNKLLLKKNKGTLILDATRFQTLHVALRRRIALAAIYMLSSLGRQVSQNIIESILQVISSKISGKSISIFNELMFKYQYNQMIFKLRKKGLSRNLIKQKKLLVPGKTKIEEIGKEVVSTIMNKKDIPEDLKKMSPFTAFIDYGFSGKELFIRSRQKGDKFCPLGIKGHKKIKDYFIDKKVPREERDFIPLVTNKESILWIIGYQISELAKVKEHTQDVLVLEIR
ncbi:MAG: tRNA lysidine(34) synthetase TilS, partial [Nitrospinota bacterium]|nr:tRNA lysidine(34) synthetase TilS [Nitrospinota bacterium]